MRHRAFETPCTCCQTRSTSTCDNNRSSLQPQNAIMPQKSFLLLALLCACGVGAAAAFGIHQGCYSAAGGDVRAFPFLARASDTAMTIEGCRKLASNRFVSSFSLEQGRECRLDPLNSGLAHLTRFGASEACDVPCSGDTRIVCGGQQAAASVYALVDPAAPVAVPPNDYTAVGCFKDDASVRRLTLLWVANSSMTLDLCASVAFSEQWLVFGVADGSECWAGQAEDAAKSLGASSSCTVPCPGNAAQNCGGPLALNLFARKTAPWLAEQPAQPVVDSSAEEDNNKPKAIVGTSCVGAAASLAACRGVPESAGGRVAASRITTVMAVAAAAFVMLL